MRFFIAYKDTDYMDFHEEPWIAPSETGFSDIESARLEAKQMKKVDSYNDVTLFAAESVPETITWEFVERHKIQEI